MPNRFLCNGVQRENVKACPDLASGVFCYVPLHNIWYGINDYGLSQARLKAIPLISGLAAIGGVFIITTTTFSPTNDSTMLLNIFTLNARSMLVALTFGFAPNLLIRNLQKGEDRYASNLESTRKK